MKLSDRIEALLRNFYLSLSILETANNGRLILDNFSFLPRNRNPFDQANMREESRDAPYGAIQPAVRNNFKATFAFTAVEVDAIFRSMFVTHPVTEEDINVRYVRVIIALLGQSFIADPMNPVWECSMEFCNVYETYNPYRRFDAREIDGTPIDWEQFGGIQGFVLILQNALEIIKTAEKTAETTITYIPNELRLKSRKRSAQYEHLKDFIMEQCDISDSSMSLAGSLFDSYETWASGAGITPLSQRGFGIGLREFGFERKRRGQGKHWWIGIGLIADGENKEQIHMSLDL